MKSPEIYEAHLKKQNPDGSSSLHPAGRFMIHDGNVHILSDYHNGTLSSAIPSGPVTDFTNHRIANPPSDLDIASHSDIKAGKRLDLIREAKLKPLSQEEYFNPKPSVFDYFLANSDKPHVLEMYGGHLHLDGNKLSRGESQVVLHHLQDGHAKIRYPKNKGEIIRKMEDGFWSLKKAEEDGMDHDQALQHVRQAVAAGHIHPDVERSLTRAIFEDKMTKGLGNKYAWESFAAKNKPGVYVSMDGNDFKSINDTHGHEAGDSAIKAFGKAAREAMDEAIGRGSGKLFRNPDEQDLYRNGGDEFIAYVPSHEHAAVFARKLREKLEAMPPINGVHKMSMSFGFGNDHKSADQALYHAKKQKLNPDGSRKFQPGQAPSFAHSLVSGSEGPVPLHQEQVSIPREDESEAPKPVAVPNAPSTAAGPTPPKAA